MNLEILQWVLWIGMWLFFWHLVDALPRLNKWVLCVLVVSMCIFFKHWG